MNQDERLSELLLSLVPANGNAIGNLSLREKFTAAVQAAGLETDDQAFERLRDAFVAQGLLAKGKGRGGSVQRARPDPEAFGLATQEAAARENEAPHIPSKSAQARAPSVDPGGAQIIAYRHADKRKNNPEVGMVKPENDPAEGKTRWAYDPHLDPALQFDSQRSQVEALLDSAINELSDQDAAVLSWLDHALAGPNEAAVREVVDNLRKKITSGVYSRAAGLALEELKRLQAPYLNWAGKAEGTSFEVDTVSLHVHERIDPASILSAVRKRLKGEKGGEKAGKMVGGYQADLFAAPFENLPLRDAIDFYKHEKGWSNRLVAGDSLLVMNSLLKKEGMAGRVQMIYIDPPYGIKYGSNFQPFTHKRDVKDRKDEDLTQEPEMIKAFRDTWELGIHSYLTYLRDRLLLARELLHESGSVFVQISDENLHHVREVMDEVFGTENALSIITVVKTSAQESDELPNVCDYLIWYARKRSVLKLKKLWQAKEETDPGVADYNMLMLTDGRLVRMSSAQQADWGMHPPGSRAITLDNIVSQRPPGDFLVEFRGVTYRPITGYWKSGVIGMGRLALAGRLERRGSMLRYVRSFQDFPFRPISNFWSDARFSSRSEDKEYVVQTAMKVIERCLLMTTDPGDLVLDPTCGSGTTAFVAEKWGRRWITCDTSRVAVTLAKQRLMTASYDYYELRYPHEGLKGGFIYKTVPHVTLKSIANNPEIDEIWERMHPAVEAALMELNGALTPTPLPPAGEGLAHPSPASGGGAGGEGNLREWEVPFDFPADWPEAARQPFDAFHAARQSMQKQMDASIAAHADQETLYDQPQPAKNKLRITGPFSVEAVPFPSVKALDEARQPEEADAGIARSGESARQHQWRDELLKTGIRGKGGQMLKFADLETLPGTPYLHAVGNLDTGERVVVSFGPEHAALEQRQVEMALREAETIRPAPRFIVFTAFTFDPEAAKDIDEMKWPGVTLLKAQMNTDLLTEDLKKARSHNQSFWLMGQPDVEVHRLPSPPKALSPSPSPACGGGEWYQVEVHGFDYFDTSKGELVSGGKGKIAVWLLDTDYDERSLFPRQVFFPMAGKGEGWEKLKKNIRAELNEDLLAQFHGTVSLPFEAGENRKIAVKIVDDRGIESLKVIGLG